MNQKSDKYLLILGFATISLIWGSTWLAIKIGLDSDPPFFGVALRFTVAFLILAFILKLRGEKLPTDRNSIFLYLQLGICSFSLPFALVYWSEQYISSGLASILFAFYPFVVMVLSHYILDDEKITIYKTTGLIAAFVGLILIFGIDVTFSSSATQGMIAVIISVIFQATSLVFVKKNGKHIRPVAMNVGGMIVGLPIMYAIAFSTESFSSVHFDAKGILSIFYLGSFGTVITFVVYYWLLKRVQAVLLSFTSFITPIIAVIFGTLILGETLSPNIASGAALVLGGLVIVNGREILGMIGVGKK